MFGTVAGFMGWKAGQEDQVLQNLREHGQRTVANVVAIASRSEEDRPNSLTVRFSTPSSTVQADIDVGDGSGNDAKPGGHVPIVYNPSHPTEVRQADRLHGSEADGIRLGSVVFGLLAAGFLVGTATWCVSGSRRKRTRRLTPPDPEPERHDAIRGHSLRVQPGFADPAGHHIVLRGKDEAPGRDAWSLGCGPDCSCSRSKSSIRQLATSLRQGGSLRSPRASRLGRSDPRLYAATSPRASKIMAPTSCFTGQVHRLPDAPESYGAMITRAKAAPAQSRSTDLVRIRL
ncbi:MULTISPECIES: DUF3592 domain-containing protein [unclassified Streptomyces]|uniref:DUF3592 domain-containing protein n=1 Tax=unclassified Streptomyces TaxID=2593676 RepID=UPI0034322385